MHSKLLILGGTGFVGRSVCDLRVDRQGGAGGVTLVPSRHPERARHLQLLPTVRLVRADVHDETTLTGLLQGCDAVLNLVAILHGSANAFERAHVALPATLARACARTGVRRVLHVSALGVDADAPGTAPSRYLRSKGAGEATLRAADLDLTVLRPSVIFGAHDRFLNLFAQLQSVFPVLPLAGADARFQPVWVQDVAAACLRCLDDPGTIGRSFELAGPQVFTLRELVQAAGAWSGHPRPVLGLPGPLARLQAGSMELLPGPTLMSRDNLDSMRRPNVASGRLPGLADLGIVPASLQSVAPDYLGAGRGVARFDRWRRPGGGRPVP